jgi:L,D-transpeptidase ErfK/SrfK
VWRQPTGGGALLLLLSTLSIVSIHSMASMNPGAAAAAPKDPLESLRPLVGEPSSDLVLPGDTLLDIAFRNGVGFEALTHLNPGIDTWIPVPGTVVQIPSQAILPQTTNVGLVINIPEMRLFDFTVQPGPKMLAAAVGDPEDPTPTGQFRVRGKRVDPVWYVPKSIRLEKPELPAQVPAGPDNPLGSRWMRIGSTSYGIHGTNSQWSIGREATHGCVRLFEADIQELFERIPDGTPLQIVYQPFKWGRQGSQILVEAHPDRYALVLDRLGEALAPIREAGLIEYVDVKKVSRALDESRGVPVVVGALPETGAP